MTTVTKFWAAAELTNQANLESWEPRILGLVDGDPSSGVFTDIAGCAGN